MSTSDPGLGYGRLHVRTEGPDTSDLTYQMIGQVYIICKNPRVLISPAIKNV